MISDSTYIEMMKNCSKWNSRISTDRKRSGTAVYDHQTGIVQKPSQYLYRHYTDRIKPTEPSQVLNLIIFIQINF